MLASDKDGTSSKLMLVFVNAEKEHSVNTGQLLGSRDSREAIEIVFDPPVSKLNMCGKSSNFSCRHQHQADSEGTMGTHCAPERREHHLESRRSALKRRV